VLVVRGVLAAGGGDAALDEPRGAGVVAVGAVEGVGGREGSRLAAGVVRSTVVLALEPEPPASLTSAAASTPSESTATTATVVTGSLQFGAEASRVRAAAPQPRHQSCS
jgi:hypothetical protein